MIDDLQLEQKKLKCVKVVPNSRPLNCDKFIVRQYYSVIWQDKFKNTLLKTGTGQIYEGIKI